MGSISEEIPNVVDNSVVAPSSPLYLLPSDSPDTVLVTTTFDGTGYGSGRRGMLLGLSCKHKLGMINGTVTNPSSNSALFEPWTRCNDMVVAWILNSLDREIRETVKYTESAEKLWKEIERRFGQASEIKIFQIRKEISSISQGNSTVASYFNRIKKLWDELSFSISHPVCICGCKEAFQRLDEEQKVHQFLMGLNESYSTIRRNILMMKPLPDVDSVYSMLINDESQSGIQPNAPSFNSDYLVYRYCKKPGHSVDKCFKLHGYPTGFQSRFKRSAAFAQVSDSQPITHPETLVCENKQLHSEGGVPSITKEQFDQPLTLLQQSKVSPGPQEISVGSANFAGLIGNLDFVNSCLLACNFYRVENSPWTSTW